MNVIALSLGFQVFSKNDGLALVPPMGWRSWNAFHSRVTSPIMESQVDALVRVNATTGHSLLDYGYDSIGLDE